MPSRTIERLRQGNRAFAHGYEAGSDAMEAAGLIRSFRKAANLSQSQLAERLGVSQSRISQAEKGEGRDGPSYALIKRVARACGVEWAPKAQGQSLTPRAEVGTSGEHCSLEAILEDIDQISPAREGKTSGGKSAGPGERREFVSFVKANRETALLHHQIKRMTNLTGILAARDKYTKIFLRVYLDNDKNDLLEIKMMPISSILDNRKQKSHVFYNIARETLPVNDPGRQLFFISREPSEKNR